MILVVELAVWWGVLIGIWMITVSPPDWPDVWLASGAALLCALLTVAARHALEDRWRPGREALRWPLLIPIAAGADTFRVLVLPLRATRQHPRREDLVTVRLPRDVSPTRGATRRAEGTLVLSATPATMVVDSAPEDSTLLVHRLASGPPDLIKIVEG